MPHMRRIALLLAALALIGVAPPARAQSGADLVDACVENGGSPPLCYGALRGNLGVAGSVCRDLTGDIDECGAIDGVTVEEELVDAHERSWLARALAHQRRLDDTRPLQDELWVHTHNSYNADVYPISVFGLDRNQIYSLRDQLRMGARAIELDLHWADGPDGRAVRVCHGEAIPSPNGNFHLGCGLNDNTLTARLREVNAWLNANPNEVVMVYLENELDESEQAHTRVASALRSVFGSKLYRPSSRCAPLPMDTSRAQIRATGARVIVTGNCGPGTWGSVVFERGPRWKEGGLDYGDDFPAYPCIAERKKDNYPLNWIRHYGDETGLSAGAGEGGDVTPTDARNMTRCGVNMIGFDNLVPFDRRLEQLVWSWAKGEPRRPGCAAHGRDGRFIATACDVGTHRVACFNGKSWAITKRETTPGVGAENACSIEKRGRWSVPWNGYENERLTRVQNATGTKWVWLNYYSTSGVWFPRG
jgi:hypothetical protein